MVLRLTICLAAVIAFSGCSIYKMNIRQGNIVEQKDVDQIKKGMNKSQIEFILGKPLVNDAFSSDTWYYVSTFKSGETNNETQSTLKIQFVDDRVVSMSGDFDMPEEFAQALQQAE